MNPSAATWMMSPALVSGSGASNIAWCTWGSNRSPTAGAITVTPWRPNTPTSSLSVSSSPSRMAACSSGTASVARRRLS